MGLAIISDILDGIFARRLGAATQPLRRADSLVDSIFFTFVIASASLAHREVILQHGALVAFMLALAILLQLPSFIKFGRAAAFHAYSAKASGLALLFAGTWLFGFGQGGALLNIALWIAIISHVELILITFMLPEWRTDVAWLGTAWKILQSEPVSEKVRI